MLFDALENFLPPNMGIILMKESSQITEICEILI